MYGCRHASVLMPFSHVYMVKIICLSGVTFAVSGLFADETYTYTYNTNIFYSHSRRSLIIMFFARITRRRHATTKGITHIMQNIVFLASFRWTQSPAFTPMKCSDSVFATPHFCFASACPVDQLLSVFTQ